MHCENIEISRHALTKALDRGIDLADAIRVVKTGEVITKYLDTKPHPCYLLVGYVYGKPLHVVVARDEATNECWLVTVYAPDPKIWEDDFKTRKN